MIGTANQNNEVDSIVTALKKKSKRTLSGRNTSLYKQARYFSPAYRDFISKIIKSGSLKIKHGNRDGHIHSEDDGEYLPIYSKRKKSEIHTDITDVDVLPHELGHAVDFWFGRSQPLSTRVVIYDNKTLLDIFKEEFEEHHEEILTLVMAEYRNLVDSYIGEGSFEIFMNGLQDYRHLVSIPVTKELTQARLRRFDIQQQLTKSKFVEVYYQIYTKNISKHINLKYSPILDALSSKYDLSCMFLDHHESAYYDLDDNRAVYEFFANCFAAKVTSKMNHIENLIKVMPKSFDAFEKLFVIYYDHIINNKRFNDVKLKEEHKI